jgi:hypothetical protein
VSGVEQLGRRGRRVDEPVNDQVDMPLGLRIELGKPGGEPTLQRVRELGRKPWRCDQADLDPRLFARAGQCWTSYLTMRVPFMPADSWPSTGQ